MGLAKGPLSAKLSAQMSEGQVLQLEELSELTFKERPIDMPKIFETCSELSFLAEAGFVPTGLRAPGQFTRDTRSLWALDCPLRGGMLSLYRLPTDPSSFFRPRD